MLALSDLQLAQNRGDAVISLLERAEVAPLPVLYGLAYDYVAGVGSLKAARAGEILAGTEGGPPAQARLYEEFVAPYENRQPLERAIDTMVARLGVLHDLMARSAQAASDSSRSLAAASQHFDADRLDPGLLREWILRLKVNNERLRRANAELTGELLDVQHEMVSTQAAIARSKRHGLLDPLTGVHNRAGIDDMVARLMAAEPGIPLSIAVLDVDHLKSLNDTYGHPAGDEVLRLVTKALVAATGSRQTVGRLGGDEFVVLMPGQTREAATAQAENLRRAVKACDLTAALGEVTLGEITASLGVAELQPGERLSELFERADRLLYRAKQAGRNRVEALVEDQA